jgi:predicted LPLAT superfamily acyltransferase
MIESCPRGVPTPALSRAPAEKRLPASPGAITHWEYGWNLRGLRFINRVLPSSVFKALADLGVWAAVSLLPARRAQSRRYLGTVLPRPVSRRDVWRHYRAFLTMHVLRLRVSEGRPHHYRAAGGCEDFVALMTSPRPALLGTFHLGNSDLLGFFLGQFQRHVHMVRFRLGDPDLLRQVAQTFGAWVTFIWVNEQENMLFALKHAIDSGGTVAMKCDRDGYSARRESFRFLGVQRSFPFTIYHLGILFKRPVTFCIGVPSGANETLVRGFPVFEPDEQSKESNLQRARAHFRNVLDEVELLLRAEPYLWFNFDDSTSTIPPVETLEAAPEGDTAGAIQVPAGQSSVVVVN